MMTFRRVTVFLLFLLGFTAAGEIWAQAQQSSSSGNLSSGALGAEQGMVEARPLEVIGTGMIYRDNVAAARDNAIQDALQGAVEQAVGLVISPEAIVQDFQLLSDRVYGQTQSFILEYRVLTESRAGRHYRVLVRATVSIRSIQDTLEGIGVLETQKGMPKVVFLISEQNIGAPFPEYWWGRGSLGKNVSTTENAFSEFMREKGFVILNRDVLDAEVTLGPAYRGPELSDEAAANLGHMMGADFAIVGKGVARYSGNIRNGYMKSIEATVFAKAVEMETGNVIASSEGTKAVVHFDEHTGGTEALFLSASEAAQGLSREIEARWRKETKQAVLVELVVRGIAEYGDFVRFRRQLKSDVPGVKNVYLRSIRAGEATMDVDIVGNARILADELMVQRFDNFALNIFEVSDAGVRLELIPSHGAER